MQRRNPDSEPTEVPRASDNRDIYAGWRCLDCGVTRSGFISPFDYMARRCLGVPRDGRTDGNRICGGAMEQIYREGE